jgi:outer membrane protein W
MMNMKKLISVFAFVCITVSALQAQRLHNLYGLSWEVGFPTGDFVTKPSLLGGKVEYRHFIKEHVSVGATIGWNNFEEYVPRQTYENQDQTSAITTDNQRFVFSLPITADLFYYFGTKGKFRPYAGIGLGGQYTAFKAYYNIYVTEDKGWGFVARPQIGTLVNLGLTNPTKLILAAGYNYSTNKSNVFRTENFQNFWLSLGISFTN